MSATLIDQLTNVYDTDAASLWSALRELLKRDDNSKRDDAKRLRGVVDAMATLQPPVILTTDDLRGLKAVIAEFESLADADTKAEAAAERVAETREMQRKAIVDHDDATAAERLAAAKRVQHIHAINAGLADATRAATDAAERVARRVALLGEYVDLLGAHAEKQMRDEAAAAALAAEKERERKYNEGEAIKDALIGGFRDALPADLAAKCVEMLAQGVLTRGDVDPLAENPHYELELGDRSSDSIKRRVYDRVEELARPVIARLEDKDGPSPRRLSKREARQLGKPVMAYINYHLPGVRITGDDEAGEEVVSGYRSTVSGGWTR